MKKLREFYNAKLKWSLIGVCSIFLILSLINLLFLNFFLDLPFSSSFNIIPIVTIILISLGVSLISYIPLKEIEIEFIKNKKNYILKGVIGGIIYSILGLIFTFYLFVKGIGGGMVNPILIMLGSIFIFIPFLLIVAMLPIIEFFSLEELYFFIPVFIIQFLFGFFLSIIIIYYKNKNKI